jgi:hypothetical protein
LQVLILLDTQRRLRSESRKGLDSLVSRHHISYTIPL